MPPIVFRAPWSNSLRRSSWIVTAVLLLISIIALFTMPSSKLLPSLLITCVGIGIPLIAAICAVRSYVVTESAVEIRRTGWTVRLPLQTLRTVEGNADALTGSIKLMGNAGLFSFTGFYWSKRLGFFRVYATDPSRAVVLRYPNRNVVITPHDPQAFIVRVRTLIKTRDFPM